MATIISRSVWSTAPKVLTVTAVLGFVTTALAPRNASAAPLYSPTSPFNQPIGEDPTVDPGSSLMVAGLVAARALKGFPIAVREWTIPAYIADASTPRYDVPVTSRPPGWRWDSTWRPAYDTMVDVPIPDHARPDPKADGHMTVLDPASGCQYDLYGADRGTAAIVLRPDGDIVSEWRHPTTPTAWEALDDDETPPTSVPSIDYIHPAGTAGRVTEVTVGDPPPGTAPAPGRAWFFANTGASTRLKVDVVWHGVIRASTIVPARRSYRWHSIEVPASASGTLKDLRLRFTALDGGDSNVRAAHYSLSTGATAWSAKWGNTIRTDGDGIYPDGMSSRASGFSLAGMIWPEELRAGQINHALVFAHPYTKAGGPVWPATAADGLSMFPGAIPIGARVQLDPDLDLDSLGLKPYEKVVARALQEYGMILGDTGGALSLYAISAQSWTDDPYAGLLPAGPYSYLSNIPVDRFRVLATGPQTARTSPPTAFNGCGHFR